MRRFGEKGDATRHREAVPGVMDVVPQFLEGPVQLSYNGSALFSFEEIRSGLSDFNIYFAVMVASSVGWWEAEILWVWKQRTRNREPRNFNVLRHLSRCMHQRGARDEGFGNKAFGGASNKFRSVSRRRFNNFCMRIFNCNFHSKYRA